MLAIFDNQSGLDVSLLFSSSVYNIFIISISIFYNVQASQCWKVPCMPLEDMMVGHT